MTKIFIKYMILTSNDIKQNDSYWGSDLGLSMAVDSVTEDTSIATLEIWFPNFAYARFEFELQDVQNAITTNYPNAAAGCHPLPINWQPPEIREILLGRTQVF